MYLHRYVCIVRSGASPLSLVWGEGFIGTQTHLPPKLSFSSDFGHCSGQICLYAVTFLYNMSVCCPLAVLSFCVTSTFSVEFPFRFMFCLVCCPCVPVLRPGRKRTRCAMFRRRAAPPRYEVVELRPPPGRGRVCPLPGLIELINTASTD